MSAQLTLIPQDTRAFSPTIPALLESAVRGEVTWTDLFCGGGGSSLGLHHVPGFRVKYALNHWDLAIQAHQANFPDTDHEVTLIEDVHPSRFGRTDCAWFSPSCTAQAYCGPRGGDDASVRSRATMHDVIRWASYHRYDCLVIENVVEVKLWCDEHRTVGPTGTERACSCGATFETWKRSLKDLGYDAREVYFNSAHSFVPQSRDRVYMVCTRRGITPPNLDFAPPCWCSSCSEVVPGRQAFKRPARGSARDRQPRLLEWGRYGKQYIYACPNAGCGQPVAPAVLGAWSIIDHSTPIETIGSRERPLVEATRRRIRVGMQRVGGLRPIQVQVGGNLFERPGYARVWSLEDPLRTITGTPYMAAVIPQRTRSLGLSGELPLPALATRSDQALLVRAGGQAPAPRSSAEPAMTFTAHDRQVAVVIPNKTNNVGRSTLEPMGTVTTAPQGHMLVSMRNNATATSVAKPTSTIAAGGCTQALLVYNGNPGFVRVLDDAAGTVTARDKQSVIVPPTPPEPSPAELTDEEIDDCLFRMLRWPELQRGQGMHAMPDGTPYSLDARVRTARGTYRDISDQDRVKMIGNAVSSPVAAMIGHAIARALAVAA